MAAEVGVWVGDGGRWWSAMGVVLRVGERSRNRGGAGRREGRRESRGRYGGCAVVLEGDGGQGGGWTEVAVVVAGGCSGVCGGGSN